MTALTFKQFIQEAIDSDAELSAIKAFLLREAPTQAATIIGSSRQMFRGIAEAREEDLVMTASKGDLDFKLYSGEISRKREPTTTRSNIHGWLNDWLEKTHGSRYRENSLFVTPDFSQARGYGNTVGMVFPGSDSAEWFFSPDIFDLWDIVSSSPAKKYDPDDTGEWTADSIGEFMSSVDWVKTQDPVEAAIRSDGEVMLHDEKTYSYYFLAITNRGMRPVSTDMQDAINMLRQAG